MIVDHERELYNAWGLGVSSFWHVLNPWSMYAVLKLARAEGDEKFTNRPTESGNRWQTSGSFGVDGEGILRWAKVAKGSDDIPDFEEGVQAVGNGQVRANL